jgi:predicted exporter
VRRRRLSYSSWTAFLERRHRALLAASLLLGALCALSLTRLRLDIDVLGMLPRGRPSFDEFRSFVADFGQLNQLVILVEGPELPRMQQFADDLGRRLASLDAVATVQVRVDPDALLDGLLGRWLYNYIPVEAYAEVERRLTPEGLEAQVAAARAVLAAPFDLSTARAVAADPLGLRRLAARPLLESYAGAGPSLESGYFVSPDRGALLVFVRPRESPFDTPFTEQLMAQVAEAVSQARAAVPGISRVAYTGSYAYALEDARTLRGDVARYTLLALAGVLAVFYAGYRNLGILPFVT